ncbi:MAG: RHS repeat-associated core domain-containing protein [Acidobacteriota bacterium]
MSQSLLPIVTADQHLAVVPTQLEFLDSPVSTPVAGQLTVRNISQQAQDVSLAVAAGPFDLTVAPGGASFSLAAAAERTVELIYIAADASEVLQATVTVSAVDPTGQADEVAVPVSGTASELVSNLSIVDPVSGVAIVSLDFDTEVDSSQSRTIRLVNDSQTSVSGRIDGLGPLGGAPCWWEVCFYLAGSQAAASPYDLILPGDFLDIDVTFAPVRAWGLTTKVLHFTGGDVPLPLTVRVQSEDPTEEETEDVVVDAHLILSLNHHDFGVVTAGLTASLDFRLTNSGTDAAWVELLGLGPDHCAYEVCFEAVTPGVSLAGFALAASASVDLRAIFAPAAEAPAFALAAHFAGGAEPAVFTALGAAKGSGQGFGGGRLEAMPLDIGGFRGLVNDNTFVSDTNIDSINTMTGNLVVTLPIGQPFRIGPQLSHGLSLVYNGSAWDATTTDAGLPWGNNIANPMAAPAYGSNAGLGWRLSLGELYERDSRAGVFAGDDAPHWPNRSDLDWLYVGPEGSRIYFEAKGGGVYQSLGGSFLRLTEDAQSPEHPLTLEFPDGSEHEFRQTNALCDRGGRCWRLHRIRDTFGNEAEVEYNDFNTNTPTIAIQYPHDRTTTLALNRSKAAGAGPADLGDLRLLVTGVTVSSFGDGTATYSFHYAGDPGASPHGGEPDYTSPIVRGCPANVEAPNQQRMTVPVLRNLELPNGDRYRFAYNVDTSEGTERCDPMSGTLTQVLLPTEAEMRYTWGTWELPALCNADGDLPVPGGLTLFRPYTTSPGVVGRELFNAQGHAGPWTEYLPRREALEEHVENCKRTNLLVTDVAHGPNLGSETNARFRVDRFYHTTTRSKDVGPWSRGAYGLPVNMAVNVSTHFGNAWLSSETADCPSTAFDESACTVERRSYKHYRWLRDPQCDLMPFEDKPECHRTLEAMDIEVWAFGEGGSSWIEMGHSDYDGRGHYRKTETHSNFDPDGQTVTTSERTQYHGPSQHTGTSQIYLATPAASDPWLLNLFSEKRFDTDGKERVEEFDFDPTTGFLKCHRTLATLIDPGSTKQRAAVDIARRYDRQAVNGFVIWEELAGGDGGGLATNTLCPQSASSMVYRTQHGYSHGERATSQPKTASGANIGPPTLFRKVDDDTGLPRAMCSFESNTPTCEKYVYDNLGRLETIDRGWQLVGTALSPKPANHLADTTYTYDSSAGGRVHTRVIESGGGSVRQEAELLFDGLGREIESRVVKLTGDSPRWVEQPAFYHPRGFKVSVLTPQLGPRFECVKNTLCRTSKRYDIYGREIHRKSPALNRSDPQQTLPEWLVPEVEELTSISYAEGLIHHKATKQFFCDGETVTRETTDHLGRLRQVEVELTGMSLQTCPDNGLLHRTRVDYANGTTTTTRTARDGATQSRIETRDGRGFLTEEIQPEWQDGAGPAETATYGYDPLGNVIYQSLPDGTELWHERDGRGRVREVFTGSQAQPNVLKVFTYATHADRLNTRRRFNRLTEANTFGYFDRTVAVDEIYGYDSNGLVESRQTLVMALDNGDLLHDVRQSWVYDDLGQVRTSHYPACAAGAHCGTDNSGAPPRELTRINLHGALHDLERDGALLARLDYHPNGVMRRIDYWGDGARQWTDNIATGPFGAPTITRIDYTDAAGNLRWDSGEYFFNGRGNLRAMVPPMGFLHDELDRQTYSNRFGKEQFYTFDDFDNLLEIHRTDDHGTFRNVFATDAASNRLQRVTSYEVHPGGTETIALDIPNVGYDDRGQLTQFDRSHLAYGPFGESMAYLRELFGHGAPDPDDGYEYQAIHLYNAGDERVLTVDRKRLPSGADESLMLFFARDLDSSVLREFRWTAIDGIEQRTYKDYYWGNGRLVALEEVSGGQPKLLHAHTDHLGSVRRLTDGQLPDANQPYPPQEFHPWGDRVVAGGVGAIEQRVGFTGQEVDRNDLLTPATDGHGLTLDFGARGYVPIIGRFLSPDPARDPSAWSLYAYAGNNPIMHNDPTGLECNNNTVATGGECGADTNDDETSDGEAGEETNEKTDEAQAEHIDPLLEYHDEMKVLWPLNYLFAAKDLGVAYFITPFTFAGGAVGDISTLPLRLSGKVDDKLQEEARDALGLREGDSVPAPLTSIAVSIPIRLAGSVFGVNFRQGVQPRPVTPAAPEPFVPPQRPKTTSPHRLGL